MKPRIKLKLRLVPKSSRPLAKLSAAEKLANAMAFLAERNRYILTKGSKRPRWGVTGEVPQHPNALFMQRLTDADRRGPRTFFGCIAGMIRAVW